MRRGAVALAVAGVLGVAGCAGPGTAPSVPPGTSAATTPPATTPSAAAAPDGTTASPRVPDRLAPSDWVAGLTTPWGLDLFADGSALVTERDTGRVLRVDAAGTVVELATAPERGSGEGGLLGATLSPDETALYLYYSTAADNRVVRHPLSGNTLGSEELVLGGIPVATFHNGGQVRFGPDGFLYVSTGDAGDTRAAQDPESLAGKILRLTPDGAPAPGNPFGTAVWSLGHRNVQGLAWDSEGRLWASEFGQNSWDELNLVEPGNNYGWPLVEGEGEVAGMTPPVLVWPTSAASPSGLAYWRGSLWMAGLRGERLWQVPVLPAPPETTPSPGASPTGDVAAPLVGEPVAHWVGEYGRLRAVATAGDTAPLLVGTSNTDGRGRVRAGDDRLLRVG